MKTELKIGGMSCQNCVKHVKEALLAIPGVEEAQVSLEEGRGSATHDGVDAETLVAAIEEEGYEAEVIGSTGEYGIVEGA
jgi:copper chaperone